MNNLYSFNIANLIGVLIFYQSFVFLLFLILSKKNKRALFYTLIAIFSIICLHFAYITIENTLLNRSLMLGIFFGVLYGPLIFIYAQSLIFEDLKYRKISFHFIPAFISGLLLLVFLFTGDSFLINENRLISVFISIYTIIYFILSILALNRYEKKLTQTFSSIHNIRLWWLKSIIYLFLGIFALVFIESLLPFQDSSLQEIFFVLIFVLILVAINCLYYLGLRQVGLFSGFQAENDQEKAKGKYVISSEELSTLLIKLKKAIKEEKSYLDFDLSLNDLSHQLNTSTRKLSYIINTEFNQNFFEFINAYRIEEAKTQLLTSSKSVKEVMYDCGFGNKSTFNAIFKKHTGFSPSLFRKNNAKAS